MGLGAAAGLVCALIELGWLVATSAMYFDGPLEVLRLALVLAALGGAVGALAGLARELLQRAFAGFSIRGRALGWTAVAAPFVVWVATQVFAGPQARTLPGHQALAAGFALASLAAIFLGQRLLPRVPAWAAGLAAVTLYVADQKILPRLYPFFHLALGLGVLVAAHLMLQRRKSWPRWAAGALLVAGAVALFSLGRQRALRTLILERAALAGPIVRLSPAPAHKPTQRVDAVDGEAPLPSGPRLGDVDVFVITIDAFRADRLNPETAPHLTELAERGVRFDRAYAQVPHTSFSIATLLTGKFVYSLSELGLEAAGHQTLAQVLKRERYKTAAFYPPSVFFIDHDRLKALEESAYGFEYVKYEYLAAPRRTQQIIDFLEAENPKRAFVWVHYLEPHEPYDPHPGFTRGDSAEARYDGEIRFVDAEVARLVDYLKAHRPHALLVVAADHGEEFGEHGGHYHGTTLYEEQVRVPLFFTPLEPNLLPVRRVAGPVGLVDVGPTVLGLLGIPPSAKMRGRDLGPFLSAGGAPEERLGPEYAEIDRKKMIVAGREKLICDVGIESCQLFDLAADPGEHRNLYEAERDKADRLSARLVDWMQTETVFERRADSATERVLERGRRGEPGAALELAQLLPSSTPETRREIPRLLLRLPPEPRTLPFLDGDDPALRILRARLGGHDSPPRCADSEELCPFSALVTRDPLELAGALEVVGEDRALAVQLIAALGQTHDPRALDPLLAELAAVRTRLETVRALEALGDARAVPFLARWVAADPYIPVRAAMCHALGALGAKDPAARSALVALVASEREPEVLSAAKAALTSLR